MNLNGKEQIDSSELERQKPPDPINFANPGTVKMGSGGTWDCGGGDILV